MLLQLLLMLEKPNKSLGNQLFCQGGIAQLIGGVANHIGGVLLVERRKPMYEVCLQKNASLPILQSV